MHNPFKKYNHFKSRLDEFIKPPNFEKWLFDEMITRISITYGIPKNYLLGKPKSKA